MINMPYCFGMTKSAKQCQREWPLDAWAMVMELWDHNSSSFASGTAQTLAPSKPLCTSTRTSATHPATIALLCSIPFLGPSGADLKHLGAKTLAESECTERSLFLCTRRFNFSFLIKCETVGALFIRLVLDSIKNLSH